ncbi:MAG: nickel pincer cofactor biosynthesis protein LarB [Chloroflexota bacterium]|nr:nickel pincer cofactor biosynthesis protein LarB [Chloroflexota bacterium]
MDEEHLRQLLKKIQAGQVGMEEALAHFKTLPYEDLGFAKIDHHRALRQGFPEVVFGAGKSPQQLAAIMERIAQHADRVLATKVPPESVAAVREALPEVVYNSTARTLVVDRRPKTSPRPGVMVLSGGTADLPVAEEAALTAELMDNQVVRVYDVGVAGLHRVLDHLPQLREARVLVVVAGMEGALPSVVSGLVSAPVIAVPTSTGYGAAFGGLAPLLAMLNSCAAGVAVVNIDNGFGAGYLAGLINRAAREPSQ